jgi:formylglycine-generating enzyme required for sulfatase activity
MMVDRVAAWGCTSRVGLALALAASLAAGCSGGDDVTDPGGGTWVTVEPGTFLMGAPEDEPGRAPMDEEVQHEVTLTHRYRVLSTEVTQAQFEAAMGYNPSVVTPCGTACPVQDVSWYQAAAYCNALSELVGLAPCYTCTGSGTTVTCEPSPEHATPYACPGYRLPTEAEWEYAARAGTTTATYNGTVDLAHTECEQPNPVLDSIAWFCGNSSSDEKHAVGAKAPNAWGLADMLGNVNEWTGDWYGDYAAGAVTDPWGSATGTTRVYRGGSIMDGAVNVRAARREGMEPTFYDNIIGFRPVRTLH